LTRSHARADNHRVLCDVFVRAWDGDASAIAPDELEPALQALVVEARAARPTIELDAATFVRWIATRVPPGPLASVLPRLRARAGDHWLACACAGHDPVALAAFDREVLASATSHLQRIDSSPAFAEEVAQILREKLFVGEADRAPRIEEYVGSGSLASWVRVIATRVALNLRRARTVTLAQSDSELEVAVDDDAALAFAKQSYRVPFQEAVRSAVAGLTPQQRTVLRLHYVDGLSIDKIGPLYDVHRSTVARWLADTRDVLRRSIREQLRSTLSLTGPECESMVSALYSQVTFSLGSLLR
jgi:RNA polymerase sigma-70 factor (ECF subfamily)